ncbi:MAG: hypothetical protein AABX33_01465 [Nanoarchaeota archaeon]
MHDIIKKDIISVLTELVQILKINEDTDTFQIKELSNHVIHNASIFQDEDSISVAILIYSLSKLIDRGQNKLDYAGILAELRSSISSLEGNDDEGFRKSIKNIFDFIRTIDVKLKLYINEVINQAQIKKGCKLCEHGISVARASQVLGISQWELLRYLGQTTLIDKISEPVHVVKRLKMARGLFS